MTFAPEKIYATTLMVFVCDSLYAHEVLLFATENFTHFYDSDFLHNSIGSRMWSFRKKFKDNLMFMKYVIKVSTQNPKSLIFSERLRPDYDTC